MRDRRRPSRATPRYDACSSAAAGRAGWIQQGPTGRPPHDQHDPPRGADRRHLASRRCRRWSRAQGAPIHLGTLTPLTGAGGPYGPVMANCVKAVIDRGERRRRRARPPGRSSTSEDDQTNPEAGLRAARKLIDVDRVAAIMGTWASSVTTAVAPLCWESKTFLTTVSGADSITALPHNGWLIRTQPNTTLQGRKFGEYAVELGAKKVFFMAPQTPFTQSQLANMKPPIEAAGGSIDLLIYDDAKPSLRTEVDQAMRARPGCHHPRRLHARHHGAAARHLPRRLSRQAAGLCLFGEPADDLLAAERRDRGHLHPRARPRRRVRAASTG